MAAGLRDGLAGAEGLGDTRDLEALLRMVGEREAALRKLAGNDALGIAAFFEDGLKIESYGGTDNGAVDWKAANQLAALGDSADVVMFANMTKEAAYDGKARAYMEALVETAYAMAMKVSEVKVEDDKMANFKAMAKMFDTTFRPDAVALWEAFSGDFGEQPRQRAGLRGGPERRDAGASPGSRNRWWIKAKFPAHFHRGPGHRPHETRRLVAENEHHHHQHPGQDQRVDRRGNPDAEADQFGEGWLSRPGSSRCRFSAMTSCRR